jgi:hypothetical protein
MVSTPLPACSPAGGGETASALYDDLGRLKIFRAPFRPLISIAFTLRSSVDTLPTSSIHSCGNSMPLMSAFMDFPICGKISSPHLAHQRPLDGITAEIDPSGCLSFG